MNLFVIVMVGSLLGVGVAALITAPFDPSTTTATQFVVLWVGGSCIVKVVVDVAFYFLPQLEVSDHQS